jgi:hypothetical protein
MDTSAANRIRAHLTTVERLRAQTLDAGQDAAVSTIKRLQEQRFRGTYADVLRHPTQGPAARFFLDELYGDHDFRERDAQFARIATAIERLFPEAVAELAVDLAEMHALTETLDHALATHWLEADSNTSSALRYVQAWRATGQRQARERQLAVVQHMGIELQRLTRSRSLLVMLKMMRKPAQAAGLSNLQRFLETGFAAFGALGDARPFLHTVTTREGHWINALFDDLASTCAAALAAELCATSS